MKVLIISDSHGVNENIYTILEKEGPVDMLFHCGDTEGSEYTISMIAGCACEMVMGNNDFFSTLPKEREFELLGRNILLTHGHYYYVSMGTERIMAEGIARGADIVIFGHTHRPVIIEEDGITIINPGSVSYPRQPGRKPSYIIMNIEADSDPEFEIKYLGDEEA